jgi:hypothetical protein
MVRHGAPYSRRRTLVCWPALVPVHLRMFGLLAQLARDRRNDQWSSIGTGLCGLRKRIANLTGRLSGVAETLDGVVFAVGSTTAQPRSGGIAWRCGGMSVGAETLQASVPAVISPRPRHGVFVLHSRYDRTRTGCGIAERIPALARWSRRSRKKV